ncbi:hypothetical protein CTEN210_08035 [Chaetoceros tenuissimus]|uniref:Thioredoxin domain-containing protein n=1 Tax=Chaetoceros tenuissimus TaxID=426638 RepID=A0AAD3H6B9_9STRA|nr:hypothetical protein CTEN210_08035 [Chaetoceros tenuissimus]
MSSFAAQFGTKLVTSSNEEISPAEALAGKDNILLYFSAHWCPPCRRFTPMLIQLYKKLKDENKNFELVFCSLDNDESAYKEYIADMPWKCMPFEAPESKILANKFKASGIPHLVVLDGEGKVITMDGTREVQDDFNGKNFPWKPKSMPEIMSSVDTVLMKDNETISTSTLKDKYLMLYFSASWCPPCRMFTPKLSEAYTKLKAERDDFELLFVSSDRDEDSFKEYFGKMSFGALPFEHRDVKSQLSKKYSVQGIPKLIILGPEVNGERELINDNVRSFIETEAFSEFPFYKKNYGDIESAEDLNATKAVILFHENGDDDEQNEIKDVAKEVAEKLKEKDGEDALHVYYVLSPGSFGTQIRKLADMPTVQDAEDAAMMIIDIPDEGGYYKSDETDLTVENVLSFIENPGDRKQMA